MGPARVLRYGHSMVTCKESVMGRACVLLLCCLAVVSARAADIDEGKRIFESVCASCHGPQGMPDPDSPVVQALDPEPADLSDPLFNSREPRGDWVMVVRHGGQALGLSAQMPAQGGNLTDDGIEAVVAYVKTLADTSDYPPGEMNLFLPVRTKKAFPEDEWVWKSRLENRDGEDVFRNVIEFEKRVGKAGQTILEIIHADDGVDSEFVAVPLQSEGEVELAPYLAYAKQLNDAAIFQGSARVKLQVDDFDQGELELAGIVHYTWSPWPRRVFPGLEVTATAPFDRNGEDAVQFTALPQVRIGLTRGGHVALNLGVELPLSDQAYDTRYHLTLLWDFADGGFFKGW